MGHEGHEHEEEKPLSFFASPLHGDHGHGNPHATKPAHTSENSSDLEHQKSAHADAVPFDSMDCEIHNTPGFHRHAEATTSELFYDLFFVANLTTFTSMLEINDKNSLTAYIGFFSLLWLTWYQVSLYDVRFSTDSVFERVAKAIHFGVMVGFAVIGPQWKPGQEQSDYKIYKAFGLILLVSRLTLFCQYGVTLFYTKKYKQTVIPLATIMLSTLIAAILYGALTPVFPNIKLDEFQDPIAQTSNAYIAWYVIGITETLITVCVSCIWRVISFKGTHMVQRMSLLTLIILGEGIIVICKSISKIIKNDFLWTAAVVGQIIASILIIYFLYMLYFDRIQEEHFGTIKQQWWSFLHFPLHTALVLVLQGVSLLVIWLQAVTAFQALFMDVAIATTPVFELGYQSGADFVTAYNDSLYNNVYFYVPKGVDASKEVKKVQETMFSLSDAYDSLLVDQANETATDILIDGMNEAFGLATKTLFDSLSVNTPKKKEKSPESKKIDPETLFNQYVGVFELVFMYVFVAGGLSLLLITTLAALSLPAHQRKPSTYIRLGINGICGVGLCLLATMSLSPDAKGNFMASAWMIPTLCIIYFLNVIATHVRLPSKHKSH